MKELGENKRYVALTEKEMVREECIYIRFSPVIAL